MTTKRSIQALFVCGIGVAAVLALLVALGNRPSAADLFPPLPSPNGYDELLKVARAISGSAPDAARARPEELGEFVGRNRAALDLVPSALNRDCRVPIAFSQDYPSTHMNELQDLRALSQLLSSAGQLALLEGKRAEAVRYGLDCVRLGQAVARGGVLIDVMVAQACQAVGLKGLRSMRASLTGPEAGEIIRALESVDHESETMDQVFVREKAYGGKAYPYGWWTKIRIQTMTFIVGLRGKPNALQVVRNNLLRGQARFRLFLVELALEAHKMDRGSYPQSLAALNLQFAHGLPKDPFSGGDFVYRRQDDAFQLYSVGPDRKDDGGKALSRLSGAGVPPGDVLAE